MIILPLIEEDGSHSLPPGQPLSDTCPAVADPGPQNLAGVDDVILRPLAAVVATVVLDRIAGYVGCHRAADLEPRSTHRNGLKSDGVVGALPGTCTTRES